MCDVLLPHSLKFPHINVKEVRHSIYTTHTATTLSKTYKMDNYKAGHYDQMYKYGHTGKTVHLHNKKEKRQMVEHATEDNDLQLNLVRSLHNKNIFPSTLPAGR